MLTHRGDLKWTIHIVYTESKPQSLFTYSPISLSTAELPLLYLGIYTFILLAGPGRYSADAFFVKTFHLETSSESMEEV